MARRQTFRLIYASGVAKHLASIDVKYRNLIRKTIEEQLQFDPNVYTRNRKPLRQPAPFDAEWEIRFGPNNRFRVLYDIDETQRIVNVLAIGEKVGNRLIIGEEEIAL